MFLVNLTLAQLLAILGTVSLGVVALYLWDRSRRRLTVPTLRFWTVSAMAAEVKRRKRIQQPWSLLLQLLGLALLLLAVAQLRLGTPGFSARDHVLLLDTSAWMAARPNGRALMEAARDSALKYVRGMPSGDRLMLVRADALATPATSFESNRKVLEDAINASEPGATALDLEQAMDFAVRARARQGGTGEIIYIGPGRTRRQPARAVPGLRVIPAGAAVSNCGIRSIGMRRSASDADVWEILVAVENYGTSRRVADLSLAFGGSPIGSRRVSVDAGKTVTEAFRLRTRGGGRLEAKVEPGDDFEGNHSAAIEVPARPVLRVAVYTEQPDLLRPVFAAGPELDPLFRTPAEYSATADADIVVLDRFSPAVRPQRPAIWIEPPGGAPVYPSGPAGAAALTRWRTDHPLGAGLRTRDLRLASAQPLQPADGDIVIAESDRGPLAVAREGEPKTVVLGFDPMRSRMRFDLATPLLFANILRWMHPDAFRRWELNASSVGDVTIETESETGDVRVADASGRPLPFTRQPRSIRFFVGSPGTVRVTTGDSETVQSLVLPELAETVWKPPKGVRIGLPGFTDSGSGFVELWPWLALAGLLALVLEWMLYGRPREARRPVQVRAAARGTR